MDVLKKMPGIGPKSAQRMAFHLLGASPEEVRELSTAIVTARAQIVQCRICFNMGGADPCEICQDMSRDISSLCVVAEARDLMAVERSGCHRGLYHVLGGVLSPIDGVTEDRLTIGVLCDRIRKGSFKEIILALNPTAEGEATVTYLTQVLEEFPPPVTRIGLGLPIGGEMDYADELTISRSFEGRKQVGVLV